MNTLNDYKDKQRSKFPVMKSDEKKYGMESISALDNMESLNISDLTGSRALMRRLPPVMQPNIKKELCVYLEKRRLRVYRH